MTQTFRLNNQSAGTLLLRHYWYTFSLPLTGVSKNSVIHELSNCHHVRTSLHVRWPQKILHYLHGPPIGQNSGKSSRLFNASHTGKRNCPIVRTASSNPTPCSIKLFRLIKPRQSEFKTDLDLERLPSGKFATNALVMTLGGFAYNILRFIGQTGLIAPFGPVRHSAKRRRLKTVIQELMYLAGRLVTTGRRLKLRFSRHCPAFTAFSAVYGRLIASS